MVAITNFIIAALISCPITTASNSSTSAINTTAIIDTTTPYGIELLGYDENEYDSEWGVAMRDPSTENYVPFIKPIIGDFGYGWNPDSPAPNFTECNETGYEIQNASTNSDKNPPSLLSLYTSVPLALGWSLQESNDSSNCTSFKEIETVPFALNVGSRENYNGSLVLGGWYDTNRIASTSWNLIPESIGNSSFLHTGILDVSVMVGAQPYNATLDYSGTRGFAFPDALRGACDNDSYVISFPGSNGQEALDILINNTKYRDNGLCSEVGLDGPAIFLGLPIFQNIYTFVDKTGQVYITAANQLNDAINMAPFDATATLKLPAGVTAYTATATPTKKSAGTSNFAPGFAIWPSGIGSNMVAFGLLVAWIAFGSVC